MKQYRYSVAFPGDGGSVITIDVFAGCEKAAKILAQAEQIKAGREWEKLKSITKRED